MNRRRQLLALTALAAVFLAAACGSDSTSNSAANGGGESEQGGAPDKLTFVIAATVIGPKEDMVLAAAEQLGYFAEENLEVNIENADGSQAALQAVATGAADVTGADAGVIATAAQSGLPVVTIGGVVQNFPWQMATLPGSDITSGADLKGKSIGVISLASGSAPYARAFVTDAGLDPERDVSLIPVGTGAQALAALETDQVDVLALYGQGYQVIENTGTEFAYLDNPDVFDGIRSISFTASKAKVAEDADVLTRFQRAFYKALLFTAVDPEATVRMGYEVFPQVLGGASVESKLPDDVRSMERWMESATPLTGTPEEWGTWGDISEDEWTATLDYLVDTDQTETAPAVDEVWDGSLIEGSNDFDRAAVIAEAESTEN